MQPVLKQRRRALGVPGFVNSYSRMLHVCTPVATVPAWQLPHAMQTVQSFVAGMLPLRPFPRMHPRFFCAFTPDATEHIAF